MFPPPHNMFRLAVVLVVAALIVAPLPLDSAEFRHAKLFGLLEDLAHPCLFILVAAVVFGYLLDRSRDRVHSPHGAYLLTAVIVVALGASTEVAQLVTGRDASITDFRNDCLGGAIALALIARRNAALPVGGYPRCGLFAVALACALWAIWPLGVFVLAYAQRTGQLPVLWQSSSLLDAQFSGGGSPGYPGWHLREPWPDWSKYRSLQLSLVNRSGSATRITLRISDGRAGRSYEDRYNRVYDLPRGLSTIDVPLFEVRLGPRSGFLDLVDIRDVAVFEESNRLRPAFDVVKLQLR